MKYVQNPAKDDRVASGNGDCHPPVPTVAPSDGGNASYQNPTTFFPNVNGVDMNLLGSFLASGNPVPFMNLPSSSSAMVAPFLTHLFSSQKREGPQPGIALNSLRNTNESMIMSNPSSSEEGGAISAIPLAGKLARHCATIAGTTPPRVSGATHPRPSRSTDTQSRGTDSYASRHQQAEARRRLRINERLDALRRIVPHTERANTTAFLEEVVRYVQTLQRRVMELELRLGLPPTVRPPEPPILFAESRSEAGKAASASHIQGPTAEPSEDGPSASHPRTPPFVFNAVDPLSIDMMRKMSPELLQSLMSYLSCDASHNAMTSNPFRSLPPTTIANASERKECPIDNLGPESGMAGGNTQKLQMPSPSEEQAIADHLVSSKGTSKIHPKTAESQDPGNKGVRSKPFSEEKIPEVKQHRPKKHKAN